MFMSGLWIDPLLSLTGLFWLGMIVFGVSVVFSILTPLYHLALARR